jgi:ribose transport system permease protein
MTTVSVPIWKRRFVPGQLQPFVLLGLMIAAFYGLPPLSGDTTTAFNVYDSFQDFANLGLVALALGLTVIAGEFDLSVLGMYGLGGMVAVKTGVNSPLLGVVAAVGAGVVAGAVQGAIVARWRMSSITVTLGGYLILLGLTGTLGNNNDVEYTRYSVGASLDSHIASVLSWRSIIAVALFCVVGLVMRYTRIGRDVRAVGGERRASRTAGVRVNRYVIGVFIVSGALAGLGGALFSYSIATGQPDPGLAPLIFAVTATLLGGVSLGGGRGSAVGIAAGAFILCLMQELFTILATPDYLSSLVTGGLLLTVTVFAAPDLLRYWKTVRRSPPVDA